MANKRKKPIIVEVSGGNVQGVWNVPSGYDWQLLDWDNLLPDTYAAGDTWREWEGLAPELQDEIEANYPEEYAKIQERIAEDAASNRNERKPNDTNT